MNPKLKLHLINRSTEQGFAMLSALGIGLVMFLVGVTMVVRSQGDQSTASTQKNTTQSLSATEVGLTRIQALVKLIPKLGQKNFSDWPATYNAYIAGKTCLTNAASSDLLAGNWVPVDSSVASKGQFRIVSYQYDDTKSIGTLTLAGRGGATNSFNSISSVEVQIPLISLAGVPVPGLWVESLTGSMGGNKVKGNVLFNACSVPGTGIDSSNVQNLPDGTVSSVYANVALEYPDLPSLPAVCPAPSTGNPTTPCYQLYKQPGSTATLTTIPQAITSNDTLPRAGDIKGSDNIYRYLVGKNSGGDSINIAGGQGSLTINTSANAKVMLYIQGNITMAGGDAITHSGNSTNFQVFGSNGVGSYKHANDTTSNSSYITTNVLFGGNSSAGIFLYAPEAQVGVNGGGNQASVITGTVWGKSWGGSSSNKIVITQSATWSDFTGIFTPPKTIASIQSWQRKEAP